MDVRMTVGQLKKILKDHKVPDDALITCLSDEEGNSESVVCQMYVDVVGKKHTDEQISEFSWVAGSDTQGIDLEKDKDRVFITFRPLY